MSKKCLQGLYLCIIILFFTSISANAATDWGTKGVSDTSKVANIVQLTTTEAVGQSFLKNDYRPTSVQPWRRDGRWITFTSKVDGENDSNQEVCTIKADGSSFTRLTNNAVYDSNAGFTTGDRIYFNRNSGDPNWRDQNWRMNQNGSNKNNLSTSATTSERFMVSSPDGSKIAYNPDNGSMMVANSDGTSPIRVTGTYNGGNNNITIYNGEYSWSPDSQWLVYSGNGAEGQRIYKVKADGTSHTQLTFTGTDLAYITHYWPSWSPDGSKIAYLWEQYTSNVIVPNGKYFYELRTINASNGTALKTLDKADNTVIPAWQRITLPASWSPDAKWLTYTKYYNDATGYRAIYIINTEATVTTPLRLTTGYNDNFPVWSPKGTQIVFQSADNQLSRENDTCYPGCTDTDRGDILILNMIGDYAPPSLFSWPMYMPAIQGNLQE